MASHDARTVAAVLEKGAAHAESKKIDPAVLVPYLAQATKHLGIVPTLSVSEYPPYLLARLVNSLDHVTEGRIGWNCVTGSNDGAA